MKLGQAWTLLRASTALCFCLHNEQIFFFLIFYLQLSKGNAFPFSFPLTLSPLFPSESGLEIQFYLSIFNSPERSTGKVILINPLPNICSKLFKLWCLHVGIVIEMCPSTYIGTKNINLYCRVLQSFLCIWRDFETFLVNCCLQSIYQCDPIRKAEG